MSIINVKCTFTIPVEVPDDPKYDEEFDIVANHCPGTGLVGMAVEKHIEAMDLIGCCWACALDGENEIVKDELYAAYCEKRKDGKAR